VEKINSFYGPSHILFDVSFSVGSSEVVCILGRNGAGKTTTMRSIMGLTPPRSGNVRYRGQNLAGMPPHVIARIGIGLVPEGRMVFPDLTVHQNLEVGKKPGIGVEKWTIERVYEIFPQLKVLDKRPSGLLSGGEQQMLAIGRTLMGNPSLLLMDEATAGLSPLLIRNVGEQIEMLSQQGIPILLAEQNLKFALDVSKRVYALNKGWNDFEGTVDELRKNTEIALRSLGV